MIVRVLRAAISSGRTADFHAFVVEVGLPRLLAGDGLLDVHVGLRTEGNQDIGLIVSIWRDWDALMSAIGPDPSKPYLLTPETGLVTDVTIEHFEAVEASSAERLAAAHAVGID